MFKGELVIELASVLAGPSVGMFCAEQGAEVIKVENMAAGGDVTRKWHLKSENPLDDRPAYFCSINWGKQSIAIDLKQASGREILDELLSQASICISSFLPQTAKKLGVDAERLHQRFPQLLVASINGYGASSNRAAFDAIIQAEAGFTYLNGPRGQGMTKMPVALMDVLAAHQLKEALLLAYIDRLRTGRGKVISVALLDSALTSLVNQATNWLQAGIDPQALGSEHPNIVPYGSICWTKDKLPVVLAVGSDRQFAQLCDLLEIPLQPPFESNQKRLQNKENLLSLLQTAIEKWNRLDFIQACELRRIPMGAVNRVSEAMALPQAHNLKLEQDGVVGLRSFVGEKQADLSAPPRLGQHTDLILSKYLQLPQKTIQNLRKEGVVNG